MWEEEEEREGEGEGAPGWRRAKHFGQLWGLLAEKVGDVELIDAEQAQSWGFRSGVQGCLGFGD